MTDKKVTDLTALAGASVASGDEVPIVDVSDTTMDSAGTTKYVTASGLATAVGTLLSLASTYQPLESNVNTNATTGATETLDTSLYAVHDMTMDQNCTFTFSNPAPSGKNTTFMLILRGAFTPTFPASVDWPDAAAPTYSTPTTYIFTTVDAGTTWLGQSVGKAFG